MKTREGTLTVLIPETIEKLKQNIGALNDWLQDKNLDNFSKEVYLETMKSYQAALENRLQSSSQT